MTTEPEVASPVEVATLAEVRANRRWIIGIGISLAFGLFGAVMAVLAYTRDPLPPARGFAPRGPAQRGPGATAPTMSPAPAKPAAAEPDKPPAPAAPVAPAPSTPSATPPASP